MRESIEANYYNKELKDRYLQEKEIFLSIPSKEATMEISC
jgi:hypothetical protein